MRSRPGSPMPTVRHMKAKLALMGEGGVGKTSLIRRFVLNEYQDTYLHTVGTRVSKVELTVPHGADTEVQMDMSIFDIMGQRGFKDLVRETYYHGSQALMGVCDLTRKDSLYALNEWIPSALEIAGDVPVYLVVNKKDLEERRAITEEEIRHVAEPFAAPIVYTSARTGTLVEDAFNALAIEIVDRAFRQDAARAVERGLREKVLLERILESLDPLPNPAPSAEQYPTPAGIAAEVAYLAHAKGDIQGRSVVDLGCGNGVLAIAAKLLGAGPVAGMDSDPLAVEVAQRNAERAQVDVAWRLADVRAIHETFDTVLMNPPFGSQKRHADRPFLDAALASGRVVYTFLNAKAEAYVRHRIESAAGTITDRLAYAFPIPHTFAFHRDELRRIDVVLYRLEVGKR